MKKLRKKMNIKPTDLLKETPSERVERLHTTINTRTRVASSKKQYSRKNLPPPDSE